MPSTRVMMALVVPLTLASLEGAALAVVDPARSGALGEKAFEHSGLRVEPQLERGDVLSGDAISDLAALGVAPQSAFLDLRGGTWATLVLARPTLPGSGVGNFLTWSDLGYGAPPTGEALGDAAWSEVSRFLDEQRAALRLDPAEFGAPRVAVHGGGEVVQISAPRRVDGIPVRGSLLSAALNHGNLVLLGLERWGAVSLDLAPTISAADAERILAERLAPLAPTGFTARGTLAILPFDAGLDLGSGEPVGRYGHRLAWVLSPVFAGDRGTWEGLIDAHSGELLRFQDTNHYGTARTVVGGVYPVSNDGVGPEGMEQAGWPMPFADITHGSGSGTTDTGGNIFGATGNMTTTLAGPFIRMADQCGAISETSAGNLDLGTSGGDDCTIPPGHSAGDTHSSRSGFYELNRIKEQARGHLPANAWLQNQLVANMNINSSCNAFWNGVTVNFYRSGGICANTGEIAAVFDHEWGHGMDDNDNVPTVSFPGEGIADLFAGLRLNRSCVGRGFFANGQLCSGYGDPCTPASGCTGIRDLDFANRQSGQPHDVTWSNANCSGIVHCMGAVYSEAVWDLYTRDLPAVYGMDSNTALELTTRLNYIGSGGVSTWFATTGNCQNTTGCGCAATAGYMQYITADDDNGNLNDGTPHMQGIFNAFLRHEAHCTTPAVQDSGCVGGPTTAPVVTATGIDNGVDLSWGAVPGASQYRIFRAEGVDQCDIGKVLAGETAGTSFTDSGLLNGRDYSYVVAGLTNADTCLGPTSACDTLAAGGGGGGGIPCSDLSLFQARCANTPAGLRVRYRVILIDTSHSGETITFGVDGTPDVRTINGDRAQGFQPGVSGQSFTVSVDDPPGCFPPKVVACP